MKKSFTLIIATLLLSFSADAQNWKVEIKSNVELRTWKLNSKSESVETPLAGASIKLFKGSTIVTQVTSNGNGDFILSVPPNDNFIIEVSYPGCNIKKFDVNTMDVPKEVGDDNYKPGFDIGGFIMAKPFKGIDYSGLQIPLAKIAYVPRKRNFDDDEAITQQGLSIVAKIGAAENTLIQSFCAANSAGDAALSKPDCPLAKTFYEKALTIIPGELYPQKQLEKVAACMKEKEDAAKKAKEDAEAKTAADKLAKEKADADKLAKAEADAKTVADAKAKADADKLAKEKADADKIAKAEADAKTAADAKAKTDADKIAKENSDKEKADADKIAKVEADAKTAADAKAKTDADKIAKENLDKEKENAQKTEKEKVATAKLEAEKVAKEKVTADKLAREKTIKEKADAQKSEKEKAAAEKLAKEKTDADKIAKENAAKEKVTETKPVKETEFKATSTEPKNADEEFEPGKAKRHVRQGLGSDGYNASIKQANDYFKKRRYEEAKTAYEDALQSKPNDAFATSRIAEIEKLLNKK